MHNRKNNHESYGHCKLEDRPYDQQEFYRCATKFRHLNYWTALYHVSSLRAMHPLANLNIYECRWCDGLHVTTGQAWKNKTKLKRSLKHLEHVMSHPSYAAKVPKEIQTRDAKLILDLRVRIKDLEEFGARLGRLKRS